MDKILSPSFIGSVSVVCFGGARAREECMSFSPPPPLPLRSKKGVTFHLQAEWGISSARNGNSSVKNTTCAWEEFLNVFPEDDVLCGIGMMMGFHLEDSARGASAEWLKSWLFRHRLVWARGNEGEDNKKMEGGAQVRVGRAQVRVGRGGRKCQEKRIKRCGHGIYPIFFLGQKLVKRSSQLTANRFGLIS